MFRDQSLSGMHLYCQEHRWPHKRKADHRIVNNIAKFTSKERGYTYVPAKKTVKFFFSYPKEES